MRLILGVLNFLWHGHVTYPFGQVNVNISKKSINVAILTAKDEVVLVPTTFVLSHM